MRIIIRHIVVLACAGTLGLCTAATAADNTASPHEVIADLRQRMYWTGERTGRLEDLVEAARTAAGDIRHYVTSGDPAALIEKNDLGQTPLMAAAFMGYPEVVRELLKSDSVRRSIDEVNPDGVTAWLYASMAYRQSIWACFPPIANDAYDWVALFVTLPYYTQPENPYRQTRRLLEEAGAKTGNERAKELWHRICESQDESTRAKIQESDDVLETAISAGMETLTRLIAQWQSEKR